MDPRPKVKAKTMKRLKEDIKKKLHDMNFSNFLDMTPEAQTTKEKIVCFIKIKKFVCHGMLSTE